MQTRRNIRIFTFGLFIANVLMQPSFTPNVYSQSNDCEAELTAANAFFKGAKYDSAEKLIASCLAKNGTTIDERIEAFKLLGKIGVASRDTTAAKAAFTQMLKFKPLMNLNSAEETPEVIRLFNQARVEFFMAGETHSGGRAKEWPWIAVSGSVVVVIALLIL